MDVERQAIVEGREQDFIRQESRSYLGTTRVNLDALHFLKSAYLRKRPKNVTRLIKVFKTQGCLRSHPDHHIKAKISHERLAEALHSSGRSASDLLLATDHPVLTLGPKTVLCLYDFHRIEAAKKVLRYPSRWWTVRLYNKEALAEAETNLREEFQNAYPPSDDEFYRKIRHYQTSKDTFGETRWLARMSRSKRKYFMQLQKRPALCAAFDRLLPVAGLWAGMRLGTLHKLLALHCDEELLTYLYTIEKVWVQTIFQGQQDLLRLTDDFSIKAVQASCPKWCTDDRVMLENLFKAGTLFPEIKGTLRAQVYESICSVDCLIPTLETFFEGVKYFARCRQVLICLIPCPPDQSIRYLLRQSFKGKATIEIQSSHDKFEENLSNLSEDEKFRICYVQLWLFAMRHWWEMTNTRPRMDTTGRSLEKPSSEQELWRSLARLAVRLGFNVPAGDGSDETSLGGNYTADLLTDEPGSSQPQVKRAGVPFIGDVMADQANDFWPLLLSTTLTTRKYCTSLFARRTFCVLFFDAVRLTEEMEQRNGASKAPDLVESSPVTLESSTALILAEYPTSRVDETCPLGTVVLRGVDTGQQDRRGRKDSFAAMEADVDLAMALISAPEKATEANGEMTIVIVDEDKTWVEKTYAFTRPEVQRLLRELTASDATGKGLFLEDGMRAVGWEDLYDALARCSLRRVYWCHLEQRDNVASTKRLHPSAE